MGRFEVIYLIKLENISRLGRQATVGATKPNSPGDFCWVKLTLYPTYYNWELNRDGVQIGISVIGLPLD